MGLLEVLKLKPLDLPGLVSEAERSGGGKGDQDKGPAPKLAQVAVEPETEKTFSKNDEGSPSGDTAPIPVTTIRRISVSRRRDGRVHGLE